MAKRKNISISMNEDEQKLLLGVKEEYASYTAESLGIRREDVVFSDSEIMKLALRAMNRYVKDKREEIHD